MSNLPKRRKTNRAGKINGADLDDLLDEHEAAAILGISIHRLRKSRVRCPTWAGPPFLKVDGWRVQYRRSDLEKFMANRIAKVRVVDPAERMEVTS